MKSSLLLICVMAMIITLFGSSNAAAFGDGDKCSDWSFILDEEGNILAPIALKTCEYKSGGSGWYQVKNTSDRKVWVRFKIHFKDGTSIKRAKTLKPMEETSGSSCFSCAVKNSGGVTHWEIMKIEFKD